MMLRYLIEKEFKQLKRNRFLPRLILLFPCVMMLVMPWAATLEIEDLRIAVIDHDHSPSSQRLVHRIEASRYFQLTALPASYAQGLNAIEKDSLEWEQGCDFGGWNSDVIEKLGVQAIPTNLLIAPSGRIEARDVDEQTFFQKWEMLQQRKKKK